MEVAVDQNSHLIPIACGERAHRTSVNAAVSFVFGILISWLMVMLKSSPGREVNASQGEKCDFLQRDADSASPVQRQSKFPHRLFDAK